MLKILGRCRYKKVIKDRYFLSKIWCTKGELMIFSPYRDETHDFVRNNFLQSSPVFTCFQFLFQKKNAARIEKQDGEETWALSRFFPLIEACAYRPSLIFNKYYFVSEIRIIMMFQQQDWPVCSYILLYSPDWREYLLRFLWSRITYH